MNLVATRKLLLCKRSFILDLVTTRTSNDHAVSNVSRHLGAPKIPLSLVVRSLPHLMSWVGQCGQGQGCETIAATSTGAR
jgi:hypothetical protein